VICSPCVLSYSCFILNSYRSSLRLQMFAWYRNREKFVSCLYKTVKEHELPWTKLMGVTADGAPSMFGNKTGSMDRIRREMDKYNPMLYESISKSFRTESITKYTLTFGVTCCCHLQRGMVTKLTRLIHKIAIELHLVTDSCTICSSRTWRPVRNLLNTLSYV
jgi:hypothetical protein